MKYNKRRPRYAYVYILGSLESIREMMVYLENSYQNTDFMPASKIGQTDEEKLLLQMIYDTDSEPSFDQWVGILEEAEKSVVSIGIEL